jgi:hypothetical protein
MNFRWFVGVEVRPDGRMFRITYNADGSVRRREKIK